MRLPTHFSEDKHPRVLVTKHDSVTIYSLVKLAKLAKSAKEFFGTFGIFGLFG